MKIRQLLMVAGLTLALVSIAPAYYHFVHFTGFGSPYAPIFEKFDLNALTDKTVRYYIGSDGPELLAPNDSRGAIVSQIQAAARAWNDVPTSDLGVVFGGVADPGTVQNAPAVDIVFDEIPPGLIAMGGPTSRAGIVDGGNGPFVAITRAVVVLNKDLSRQPSSSDGFFMTLVHEMGHALGLQHTFTSSVMSTSITRATTKANPLGIDDVAAISLLYPSASFAGSTGVISGRVVIEDAGVNLASVVAISPRGAAISTLSNPDGAYRIDGVPPGQYYVYVHPLPPPVYGEVSRANIVMPRDRDGQPIIANDYFRTQFYPGVQNIDSANTVSVDGGQRADGIDFFVSRRGVSELHSVTTYSFPGSVAVPSGYLSLQTERRFLVAYGFGLTGDGGPVEASVVGGSAFIPESGLTAYSPDPRFLQINFEFNPFSGTGSRHLLFSRGDNIYVLPSGLQLSQNDPPTIDGVVRTFDAEGQPVVVIAGRRLTADTRILFDGAEARLISVTEQGYLLVDPPAGPGERRATVIALNPDGQTSWFLDGLEPRTFDYEAAGFQGFNMQPALLPAGSEAMIEIRGSNTHFEQGKTVLGIGSSDVVVRDYIVLDPTLILANVSVAHNAPEVTVPSTVSTGLEVITQPLIFRTTPPDESRPSLHTPVSDVTTGRNIAYAGRSAVIRVSSLPAGVSAADLVLTLNDQPATIERLDEQRVFFTVPSGLAPGPVVIRLTAVGREAFPVLITVDVAPPVVEGAFTEAGVPVAAETPVRPSEMVQLRVADLAPAGEVIAPESLSVLVNGIEHQAFQILPVDGQPEIRIVQFFLGTSIQPGDQIPVRVLFEGRSSEAVFLSVAAIQ